MSVKEQLRRHLESGQAITPLGAQRRWGCLRLGARVYDLRQGGMDIRTDMVGQGRKRYARYRLARGEN